LENKEYKKYSKEEMIDIAKNKGFYFVEASNNDYFEIAKDDLADFIVLEADRCGHDVEISIYTPYREDEPVLTTYGCFLNRIKPKLREEIIDRLVELQMGQEKTREVKVFDNDVFMQIIDSDIKDIKQEQFFKQYFEDEEELEV
jgi:hypothetical protein